MEQDRIQKFKEECELYLKEKSLESLRCYGRHIGMRRPTTIPKQELIKGIISTLCGETPPNRNKKGAPVKNHFLDEQMLADMEILKMKYESLAPEKEDSPAVSSTPSPQAEESDSINKSRKRVAKENNSATFNVIVCFSDLSDEQKETLRTFLRSI